jgi:hypothetical protein
MSERSSYSRFVAHRAPRDRIIVILSRPGWTRLARPTTVTVGVEPLASRRGSYLVSNGASHRVTIRAGHEIQLTLDAPQPPFRVEVRAGATFIPSRYGVADDRRLGVQVSYSYR